MRTGLQQWTVASLSTGAMALVGLLLSFTTTHWLYMKETCSERYEISENLSVLLNLTMYSNAGLWRICLHSGDENEISCEETGLKYGLEKSKERLDSQWQTGTVIEATRIQFPLTCLAVVLTLSGFICSIFGNYRRDKKTIVAAVLYISSGLCLSVSVILFISRINDELSLQNANSCTDFEYSYGWSFYLIGLSFVVEETSAVISIKLYLINSLKNVGDMVRIIPGLEDKIFIETTSLKNYEPNTQTLIW
ncbi:voltage-dependent calcium channel gamma-5 subunit-like [Mercenaria mercenaria]|uniref:voltage-dependent calcium channel gamma-5 subunit-like n=1 Tax=Mercenaria mercenaria TaxID=6596 RepID=UPI001E1D5807|nr:voltage-dependent calcium channel gamma-5 subunit-like [Mercenaria mercenaria]XP_053384650.1 voltage-dependent calcium channel gamma-5 subunit-like [Mercenaria mercenaria]XP_053384654.1 voltage-dependent calcium channel gamma-5 subunit-like [Mercenaria mercenaria]XP_053384659.1 voltage-dependent calcium channel gamma-5 subunit-like [Mercenaria mercenaria]